MPKTEISLKEFSQKLRDSIENKTRMTISELFTLYPDMIPLIPTLAAQTLIWDVEPILEHCVSRKENEKLKELLDVGFSVTFRLLYGELYL